MSDKKIEVPVKKAASKKPAAKKATVKKTAVKKTAPKKATPKKTEAVKSSLATKRVKEKTSTVPVKRRTPSLPRKQLLYLINMIESQFFEENLIVCNLTPFKEIYRDGAMSVRHYPALKESSISVDGHEMKVRRKKYRVPVLLVPPLGATSVNFDLFPDRSIVKFLLAAGFNVYLVDWGEVGREHRDQDLAHYIGDWFADAVATVRQHSGSEQLSLVGYCMGGLLSVMYTAYARDSNIRNIVTVVSPVNWYENGAAGMLIKLVNRQVKIISYLINIRLDKLPNTTFHVPGWLLAIIFKMTDPINSLKSYFDGLLNMWDREFLVKKKTMDQWFNDMEDYSGAMVRDVLTNFMHDNKLASGKVKLGKKTADFTKIKSSLLSFAGSSDALVSEKAARHLLELVGSEDKEFHVVPGGHAGAFAGSKSFRHTWPITVKWLAQRSD